MFYVVTTQVKETLPVLERRFCQNHTNPPKLLDLRGFVRMLSGSIFSIRSLPPNHIWQLN
ncbi:hypothetical protein M23134_00634 [Microscilla marina ATCC 23134]|uniref:Uncharacterized protein n=1 Tax=Microscilla marina ATCC 23134 TaxID=313606 RepID=A1ZVJ3_MICM2|nr:hypothetical protein M23134_00634 [Microscilla marina ATCC 23134]